MSVATRPKRYDTLADLDRRARRWIAVEELLFATLGRWAREPGGEPAATRLFATWCHRHAWHAELWLDRLPAIELAAADHDDDEWVQSLRPELDAVSSAADAITVLRETVVPTLEAAVAEHREKIDPLLDGPTARVLDLVSADVAAEAAALTAWSVSA